MRGFAPCRAADRTWESDSGSRLRLAPPPSASWRNRPRCVLTSCRAAATPRQAGRRRGASGGTGHQGIPHAAADAPRQRHQLPAWEAAAVAAQAGAAAAARCWPGRRPRQRRAAGQRVRLEQHGSQQRAAGGSGSGASDAAAAGDADPTTGAAFCVLSLLVSRGAPPTLAPFMSASFLSGSFFLYNFSFLIRPPHFSTNARRMHHHLASLPSLSHLCLAPLSRPTFESLTFCHKMLPHCARARHIKRAAAQHAQQASVLVHGPQQPAVRAVALGRNLDGHLLLQHAHHGAKLGVRGGAAAQRGRRGNTQAGFRKHTQGQEWRSSSCWGVTRQLPAPAGLPSRPRNSTAPRSRPLLRDDEVRSKPLVHPAPHLRGGNKGGRARTGGPASRTALERHRGSGSPRPAHDSRRPTHRPTAAPQTHRVRSAPLGMVAVGYEKVPGLRDEAHVAHLHLDVALQGRHLRGEGAPGGSGARGGQQKGARERPQAASLVRRPLRHMNGVALRVTGWAWRAGQAAPAPAAKHRAWRARPRTSGRSGMRPCSSA